MSSRKFADLKADLYKRSPESRARVAEKVSRLTEDLGLAELRSRMHRTQAELAALIGTTQSGVSRLERQHDVLTSTLADYVEATGGRLRLIADYPDVAYEIDLPALRDRTNSTIQPRAFHVVWQDIDTRQLVRVGRLEFTGDRFIFSYAPDAELHAGFEPFPSLPDYRRTYESDALFPIFAERMVTTAQTDYDSLVHALGLTREQATPVEVLARSWGRRPHDTIQIVPEPEQHDDGTETLPFLVSGVRHAHEDVEGDDPDKVSERVAGLVHGQQLDWRDEPDNTANENAIRLQTSGRLVGWIPNYLLDYIHKKRGEGYGLRVTVEHANGPETAWHLRLLCLLQMSRPDVETPLQ